jgi:hypothetical protein
MSLSPSIPAREPDKGVETVLAAMIEAARAGTQRNHAERGTEAKAWKVEGGALQARRLDDQTYLLQYRFDDGAGERNYMFEVNLIAA